MRNSSTTSSTSSERTIRLTQWTGQLVQELSLHSFEDKSRDVVVKELLELRAKIDPLKAALGAAMGGTPHPSDGTAEEFLQRQLGHKPWALRELELTLEIEWLMAVRRAGAEQQWTSGKRGR